MIDVLLHSLGICSDHHSHINVILVINELLHNNFCWCYIKEKISSFKKIIWWLKTWLFVSKTKVM